MILALAAIYFFNAIETFFIYTLSSSDLMLLPALAFSFIVLAFSILIQENSPTKSYFIVILFLMSIIFLFLSYNEIPSVKADTAYKAYTDSRYALEGHNTYSNRSIYAKHGHSDLFYEQYRDLELTKNLLEAQYKYHEHIGTSYNSSLLFLTISLLFGINGWLLFLTKKEDDKHRKYIKFHDDLRIRTSTYDDVYDSEDFQLWLNTARNRYGKLYIHALTEAEERLDAFAVADIINQYKTDKQKDLI